MSEVSLREPDCWIVAFGEFLLGYVVRFALLWTELRDGDAISSWLESPDSPNSPPALVLVIALQHHHELECGCLIRTNVERAPRQRPDEVVNRIGMRCRQQHETSLRGLQDPSDCRSPQVDGQMGADFVDHQSGLKRVNRRVRQECKSLEAPPEVNTARPRG